MARNVSRLLVPVIKTAFPRLLSLHLQLLQVSIMFAESDSRARFVAIVAHSTVAAAFGVYGRLLRDQILLSTCTEITHNTVGRLFYVISKLYSHYF